MKTFLLSLGFVFSTLILFSQVGINTENPAVDSMLDINGGSNKGLLIPRVDILDLSTIDPITGGTTESLLVYNTNPTTGKGFYFWNGVDLWVNLTNFNLYDRDSSLAGNREVTQNANTLQFTGNVGRNQISIKRTDDITETGLAFKNSGNLYDAAIYMEANAGSGLVIATGGNDAASTNVTPTVIFNNDNTSNFQDNVGVRVTTPLEALHIGGASETIRVESLNESNNANNINAIPEPVYVDNSGNLILQPPLTQVYLEADISDFLGDNTFVETLGERITSLIYTTPTFTLEQESLVNIKYTVGVEINTYGNDTSRPNDGAPRNFRSYVRVRLNNTAADDTDRYAYGSGIFVNSAGGTVTNGFYYLKGDAYIQLPAGIHSLELLGEVIGGDYSFRAYYGRLSTHERFQIIIQR